MGEKVDHNHLTFSKWKLTVVVEVDLHLTSIIYN